MPITYNKLFHILIDKKMKKGELQELADITPSIMARLGRNETVRTDTIGKICKALHCQPGDIMEYIEEEFDDTHVKKDSKPMKVLKMVTGVTVGEKLGDKAVDVIHKIQDSDR